MFSTVVDELEAAVDAVCGVDLDELSTGELDSLVIGLQRAVQRLAGCAAASLARWDRSGVWTGDGSASARARLSRDANVSLTTASVALRRARAMLDMPATAAAVVAGSLSMDHVDLLAAADQPHRHDLFTRDEATLVATCGGLRWPQAARVVAYWEQRADAFCDGPEPDERPSRLHASTTFGGVVRLDGTLDAIDGEIVTGELARLEREQYLADQTAGVTRTHSERLAAALVEMARRCAATPAGAQRPKPLFSVVLGDDTFAHLCELANGTVIAPGMLIPHLGMAEVETVLFAGPFTAIAASTTRTFTGRLRRAIEVRDRHCQHPSGCDVPAPQCDVDHIVPWEHGGPTSQFNGRLECRPHNRDATKHDHDAAPHPSREITVLDAIRARIRWEVLHLYPPDNDEVEDAEPAA